LSKEVKKTEEIIEESENIESEDITTEEECYAINTSVLTDDFKKEYEAKLKEAEDKYLRVHADFENIKKRLEREKYQAIEYASENFAKDLLAPIDSLEMAIASIKADGDAEELLKKMQEGLELTIRNFKTVFEKHGIELVEIDSGFDPNFHDAVMQVGSEKHEDGEIVQLLQNGYKYKDRLLRPAMVSVCKK